MGTEKLKVVSKRMSGVRADQSCKSSLASSSAGKAELEYKRDEKDESFRPQLYVKTRIGKLRKGKQNVKLRV